MPSLPDGTKVLDIVWVPSVATPKGAFSRWVYTSSGTEADAALVMRSAWLDNISPIANDALAGNIKAGTMSGGGVLYSYIGATMNGTESGPCLPPQVSFLASKLSSTGGRHGRGRWYHPGVTQGLVTDGNQLGSGFAAQWATACNDFLIDCLAGDVILEIPAFGDGVSYTPHAVTSLVGKSRVATQRRRSPR